MIIVLSVFRYTDFAYPFCINLQTAPKILTRVEPTISSTQCEHSQLLPQPCRFFKIELYKSCITYNVNLFTYWCDFYFSVQWHKMYNYTMHIYVSLSSKYKSLHGKYCGNACRSVLYHTIELLLNITRDSEYLLCINPRVDMWLH